jgi:hypothetical protein
MAFGKQYKELDQRMYLPLLRFLISQLIKMRLSQVFVAALWTTTALVQAGMKLTILSPHEGVKWEVGQTVTIKVSSIYCLFFREGIFHTFQQWDTTRIADGIDPKMVTVELQAGDFDNGKTLAVLAQGVDAAAGTASFQIPTLKVNERPFWVKMSTEVPGSEKYSHAFDIGGVLPAESDNQKIEADTKTSTSTSSISVFTTTVTLAPTEAPPTPTSTKVTLPVDTKQANMASTFCNYISPILLGSCLFAFLTLL